MLIDCAPAASPDGSLKVVAVTVRTESADFRTMVFLDANAARQVAENILKVAAICDGGVTLATAMPPAPPTPRKH